VDFFNLVGLCLKYKIKRFIYASSSSVYGSKNQVPYSESKSNTENPNSLYAAAIKCNELIAKSYSSLHGLETIGLRFFTVYGPWGRPDMIYFKFTNSIIKKNQ
jgi:UDP-glucuronate 4-epimerase